MKKNKLKRLLKKMRRPVRLDVATVSNNVEDLVRMVDSLRKQVEALDSRLSGLHTLVNGLPGGIRTIIVTDLAAFGKWDCISEMDSHRLMSVGQGDMAYLYIEWFIRTHTRDEVHRKYGNRILNFPPNLSQLIR